MGATSADRTITTPLTACKVLSKQCCPSQLIAMSECATCLSLSATSCYPRELRLAVCTSRLLPAWECTEMSWNSTCHYWTTSRLLINNGSVIALWQTAVWSFPDWRQQFPRLNWLLRLVCFIEPLNWCCWLFSLYEDISHLHIYTYTIDILF